VDKFSTFPLGIHTVIDKTYVMRRLVKHLKTHEYLAQGRWTPDPRQALDFSDAGKAIETCLRNQFLDVELVLQLEAEPQAAFDTHLPLFDYGPRA
jgi:hypothetical protein